MLRNGLVLAVIFVTATSVFADDNFHNEEKSRYYISDEKKVEEKQAKGMTYTTQVRVGAFKGVLVGVEITIPDKVAKGDEITVTYTREATKAVYRYKVTSAGKNKWSASEIVDKWWGKQTIQVIDNDGKLSFGLHMPHLNPPSYDKKSPFHGVKDPGTGHRSGDLTVKK